MIHPGGTATAQPPSDPMPNLQARVFDAIERARVAVGIVAPLTLAEQCDVVGLLGGLGIPARPWLGAGGDSS